MHRVYPEYRYINFTSDNNAAIQNFLDLHTNWEFVSMASSPDFQHSNTIKSRNVLRKQKEI